MLVTVVPNYIAAKFFHLFTRPKESAHDMLQSDRFDGGVGTPKANLKGWEDNDG
jgi:hypothetical protein